MRGMHFNGANPELREAVHFRTRIGHRPRKHSSERDESIRSRAAVLRAPVIYFRRESDNLWCDVIDQPRAFHSESVQKGEKCSWIGRISLHIREVLATVLDQIQGDRKSVV